MSIIVVLTSTASGLVREEMFFLTSFSLFRRAIHRTPWALQACAGVCVQSHASQGKACIYMYNSTYAIKQLSYHGRTTLSNNIVHGRVGSIKCFMLNNLEQFLKKVDHT